MGDRALLIGVSEYSQKRFERGLAGLKLVDKGMPGARNDVAAFKSMLLGEGFPASGITTLVEPEQTTHSSILNALTVFFLGADLAAGDRLVFYFSGHSARVSATGLIGSGLGWKDEVLCPSDTDWQTKHISDQEFMALATSLPEKGVTLEVVLETCSASGVNDTALMTKRFGKEGPPVYLPALARRARHHSLPDLLDGGDVAAGGAAFSSAIWLSAMKGACVFWAASHERSCSYSGPAEPEGHGEPMGLFTRYFIEGYKGRSREQLKVDIEGKIENYRAKHRAWHAGSAPDLRCMDVPQLPHVEGFGDPGVLGKQAFRWA